MASSSATISLIKIWIFTIIAIVLTLLQLDLVVSSNIKRNILEEEDDGTTGLVRKVRSNDEDDYYTDDIDVISSFSMSLSGAKARLSDCDPDEGMAFHHRTEKCYQLFTKGPCGEQQMFYRHTRTPRLGRCSCIYNDDGCNTKRFRGMKYIDRPIIMAPDRRRCYYAFEQGPCPAGQWYVVDSKKRKGVCQPNPCTQPLGPTIGDSKVEQSIKDRKSMVFWFFYEGKCYQTFTQAFCGPNEFVRFWGTDPRPQCVLKSHPRRSCVMRTGASTATRDKTLFSQSTNGLLKCDAGFRFTDKGCVPYGVFETGFEGTDMINTFTPDSEAELGTGGGDPDAMVSGTPDSGADKGGTPESGANKGGTPDSGANKGGTPDFGANKGGTPSSGADKDRTPDSGANKGGTPESSAGREGRADLDMPIDGSDGVSRIYLEV